jgi:hypothetical protein
MIGLSPRRVAPSADGTVRAPANIAVNLDVKPATRENRGIIAPTVGQKHVALAAFSVITMMIQRRATGVSRCCMGYRGFENALNVGATTVASVLRYC